MSYAMLKLPQAVDSLPPIPQGAPRLVYEAPEPGVNLWIQDNFLPNASEVAERCLRHEHWELGFPHTQETWPGRRFRDALTPGELAHVEDWVKQVTGAKRLWVGQAPSGARLDFNVAQSVGAKESGPRPHTDSLGLCTYAAVIYLNPHPEPDSGTAFYRLRYPNGAVGGNRVSPPHRNLVDALGVRHLPPQAWYEEMRVENVFNRIVMYKANLVHSAVRYFGDTIENQRLAAVFFWMAE